MRRLFPWHTFSASLVSLLLLAAVAVISTTLSVRQLTYAAVRVRVEQDAELILSSFHATPPESLTSGSLPSTVQNLLASITTVTGVQVLLFNADGTIYRTQEPSSNEPSPVSAEDSRLHRPGSGVVSVAGGRERYLYVTRKVSGVPGEPSYVHVRHSLHDADRQIAATSAPVLSAIGVVLLAGVIVVFLTWKRSANAIHTVSRMTRLYASGDLSRRVRVTAPRHIAELARNTNVMAKRLAVTIQAISERKNQLEAILSSMVEGVIVLDASLRVTTMNASAALLFRTSPAEATGKSVIEGLRNAEIDEFAVHLSQADGPLEETVTIYQRERVRLQMHGTAIRGEEESPAGFLIVLNDITQLKRLEDIRRDFVANVSHELKTPVTSILGFVETLLDGAQDDPDNAARFLGIIHNHAGRLNSIIDDLLSLSRLESAGGAVQVSRCNIEEIVERVIVSETAHREERHTKVSTSYSGSRIVSVNSSLLEQAVANLVNNAVKYSPSKSRVKVAVENGAGILEIRVSDNGPGIPPVDQPRVFERFFRLERGRSRDMGGTGLGLAIVKHIALAHGGEVSLESEPGRGSTFIMRIPQTPE